MIDSRFQGKSGNASYKEVVFYARRWPVVVGRKKKVKEIPGADYDNVQDTGKLQRIYSVEGYLLGADYIEQRNKLIAACEEKDSGELILPREDKTYVAFCDTITFRNNNEVGRIITFSAHFIVRPESKKLQSSPVGKSSITTRILDFRDSIEGKVREAISLANDVNLFFATIEGEIGRTLDILNLPSNIRIYNEFGLVQRLQKLFEESKDFFEGNRKSEISLSPLTSSATEQSILSTQKLIPQKSDTDIVKEVLAVNLVQAYNNIEFTNSGQVLAIKSSFVEVYERLLIDDLVPYGFIQELGAFKDALLSKLNDQIVNLPSLVEKTEPVPTPIPLMVYAHYGNLDSLERTISMNQKPDILFAKSIEVEV